MKCYKGGMNVKWIEKQNWDEEDLEFQAKRMVDNKFSFYHNHMMGTMPSFKMNRKVRYESNNEKLFYFLLELDPQVVRYYEQPINVTIRYLSEEGEFKERIHVPDTLIFREGEKPNLIQVKEYDPKLISNEKFLELQQVCQRYANQRDWKYSLVFPKRLPGTLLKNIKLLVNFLYLHNNTDEIEERAISYLSFRESVSITELSQLFEPDYRPQDVLPVIYHMIAKGVLSTNLERAVSLLSVVAIGAGNDNPFAQLFINGGGVINANFGTES